MATTAEHVRRATSLSRLRPAFPDRRLRLGVQLRRAGGCRIRSPTGQPAGSRFCRGCRQIRLCRSWPAPGASRRLIMYRFRGAARKCTRSADGPHTFSTRRITDRYPAQEIRTSTDDISSHRHGTPCRMFRGGAPRRGLVCPQMVPAWMIVAAWEHLRHNGELTHHELLHELNVKRSAFVCALLAQFPDVVVRSTRPIVLELISR
jgi:hypothetical protein